MSGGAKDPETGGMRVDFEPGMFEMLLPGESIDLVQSNRPGTTFDPYVKLMVRTIGAAVEMPLGVLCSGSRIDPGRVLVPRCV